MTVSLTDSFFVTGHYHWQRFAESLPLNLGGLQVDDISTKITAESTKKLYQWGKNQTLSRCFSVFSVRILRGEYQIFDWRSCIMNKQPAGFMGFTLNLKNKAKFP